MFGLFRKNKNTKNITEIALEEFNKGNYRKALEIGQEILEGNTSIALSWRFVGDCQFRLNMFQEAYESFSNVDKIGGPGTEEAFLWMAICKLSEGKKEEAIEFLEWCLKNKDLNNELKSKAMMAISDMNEN